MAEPPDFDQIAREILDLVDADVHVDIIGMDDRALAAIAPAVAEQLRLVWNARGAADIALIETISPFPLKTSLNALRTLDR